MALPARITDNPYVLVEIILKDESDVDSILHLSNVSGVTRTLAAGSGIVFATDGATVMQYEDRITAPIQLQSKISIEQIGSQIKGTESIAGSVEITLSAGKPVYGVDSSEMWEWISASWKGRAVTIFSGYNTTYANYSTVYTGLVDDLTHDLNSASIKLGGTSRILDSPLVTEVYLDTAPNTAIRGKPKPKVWGFVRCYAPTLYDESILMYHISVAFAGVDPQLINVSNVTVGGVLWEEVVTINPDIGGQYVVDLVNGTIQLSGITENLELRCDVKAYLWDFLQTGDLIQTWMITKNASYDAASIAQLNTDIPYVVGYATNTDSVNMLDAINNVLLAAGAFYVEDNVGALKFFAIDEPSTTDDATYDLNDSAFTDGINNLKLVTILPRAYRIRMEAEIPWNPLTNFAEQVSATQQALMGETGLIQEVFNDTTLQANDVSAVDPPVIRTYFTTLADAFSVGFRLERAWHPQRRIYEIELMQETNELYSNINVSYKMINNKDFRIISIVKNLGGDKLTMQIWG